MPAPAILWNQSIDLRKVVFFAVQLHFIPFLFHSENQKWRGLSNWQKSSVIGSLFCVERTGSLFCAERIQTVISYRQNTQYSQGTGKLCKYRAEHLQSLSPRRHTESIPNTPACPFFSMPWLQHLSSEIVLLFAMVLCEQCDDGVVSRASHSLLFIRTWLSFGEEKDYNAQIIRSNIHGLLWDWRK